MTKRVRRSGRSKLLPLYDAQLLFQHGDERALGPEVAEEVLPQHELAVLEVCEPDEEHVRPGPSREPRRLRIQEKDVLPPVRRIAPQPEVRDEHWIDGSPPDDLEPEIVDVDPPLAHLEAERLRRSVGGRDRGTPRGGGVPVRRGRGYRRVERVSVAAADIA